MVSAPVAGISSFFVPGLGQALLGDVKQGLLFFIAGVAIMAVLYYFLGLLPAYVGGIIYSLLAAKDAYETGL